MDRRTGKSCFEAVYLGADLLQTVEYITKQLIDGYKSGDNLTQTFLDKYDFYIFPIVNPDGMCEPGLI